jgi:hypothetical protein
MWLEAARYEPTMSEDRRETLPAEWRGRWIARGVTNGTGAGRAPE